jgi:hypothetical protein
MGDTLAHDFALLVQDPQSLEQLVRRLEQDPPSGAAAF